MQTTQESKSQLARLMATENLIVEHKKVPTAYFNTKERKLVIPILKDTLTPEMYDLFVGHEVGHALNTPAEGWHDSVIDLKIPKVILNIVEDARIEKLIKRKYPGLRSSFSKAYRQLYNDNFFATEGVDLNGMNILDRLNIHFKIGAHLGIKFNEEELAIVDEMNQLETFDDVIGLSKKIQELYRQQKEKQKEKRQEEETPTDEWDDDTEYSSETMDFDDGEEEDDDSGEEQENRQSSEFSDEMDPEENESFNDGEDKVESHTDEAFRKHEKELLSEDSTDYNYANVPENLNLDNIVIPYKRIINRYKKDPYYAGQVDTSVFNTFKSKSAKVVSYLVKEFELRKNADQMKRASVAKTGELNMSKIYSYKFNDDIFKRLTIVPGGKSHGLVIFLDWSGSMINYLHPTIKQLLNLVLFCKKVNIPFEVYAFTNMFYPESGERKNAEEAEYEENDVLIRSFNLLNLFSSKMNASDMTYMASALLHGSASMYPNVARMAHRINGFPQWLDMQYTPLNETIFTGMKIVPEFQKQHKLQVVNTVFLTDGEGHLLTQKRVTNGEYGSSSRFMTTGTQIGVLRHQSTGISEKIKQSGCEGFTSAALKIFKQVTKSNVVGFYLVNSREFRQSTSRLFPRTANMDDIREKFMKEKSVVCTTSGYDEYYIVRAETDVDNDSELEVKSTTTRGLVNAFTKYNTSKVINRVVLNRFIGMIA